MASSSKKRFLFAKPSRLLTPADYQRVFDNVDCKQGGKYCTMLSASRQGDGHRLGLIAAKKNLRLAVQRNRAKRAVRETFRLHQEKPDQELRAFDVVVILKASASLIPKTDLHKELKQQWIKLFNKRRQLQAQA